MKILNQIFLTATAVVLLASCSYDDEPLDGGYYHLTVAEPYSYDSCYFMLDGQRFSGKTAILSKDRAFTNSTYRVRAEAKGVLQGFRKGADQPDFSMNVDLSQQRDFTFVQLPGQKLMTPDESEGGEPMPTEPGHVKARFFYTDKTYPDIHHMRVQILSGKNPFSSKKLLSVSLEQNVPGQFVEIDTTAVQGNFYFRLYNADVTPEKRIGFMPTLMKFDSDARQTLQVNGHSGKIEYAF